MKIQTWTQKLGLNKNKVYYLASPYSHADKERMQQRYEAIDAIGAWLCLEDIILIEPISMCHEKSINYDMPTGYEYWKRRDRTFVRMSDGVIVAKIEGWDKSIGLTDEINYARFLGKKIIYLEPEDMPAGLIDRLCEIYNASRTEVLVK